MKKSILLFLLIILFSNESIHAQRINMPLNYTWIGHLDRIQSMDSIINTSASLALNPVDYNIGLLQAAAKSQFKLLSAADSLKTDSLINLVALHFFNDLAYGNHEPSLQNDGIEFKQSTINVSALLNSHLKNSALPQLVQYFTNSSTELVTILKTLKQYRDSTKINFSRIKQLTKAANDYRWLRALGENQRVVLVNLPSAQLKVYEKDKVLLSMKLIVGKGSTQTNSFSTFIKQVTINPYWNVPHSIAVNEMLPRFKKDNDYISRTHLQILSEKRKILNPNKIDWNSYDENKFPFYIRQSTGCDNSLGVLKLEFDSPYGVYLHDTPEKSLFNSTNRFYSHGCMRMEKPIEMARLLMENRIALDTIDLEKCYDNPNPIKISIPVPTPLIVWYSLIDFDNQGIIRFYKDVYHRLTY